MIETGDEFNPLRSATSVLVQEREKRLSRADACPGKIRDSRYPANFSCGLSISVRVTTMAEGQGRSLRYSLKPNNNILQNFKGYVEHTCGHHTEHCYWFGGGELVSDPSCGFPHTSTCFQWIVTFPMKKQWGEWGGVVGWRYPL